MAGQHFLPPKISYFFEFLIQSYTVIQLESEVGVLA